jgi:hypothetical protein
MSGVAKGVKKVFKTVGKVAKKVLPFALPAAALIFTGGAALGLTPSFGAMAGGLIGKLGLGSTMSSVLTGAVTHAGFGGLAGGAIGALTGGKQGMRKGLGLGQLAGAATGGISGYMNAPSLAGAAGQQGARGLSQATGASAPRDVSESTRAMTRMGMEGGGDLPGQTGASSFQPRSMGIAPPPAAATGMGYSPPGAPAGGVQTQAARGITSAVQGLPSAAMTGATGLGGAQRSGMDPYVQAHLITALGGAFPAVMKAATGDDDDENQQLQVENARREAIASNYAGTGIGTYQPTFSTGTASRAVTSYRYDPQQGRIVPIYG